MEESKLVRIESQDGTTFDMIILNEFDHKNKKYALLMEINDSFLDDYCEDCGYDEYCSKCGCANDECKCGEDCDCDCDCDFDCECDCDCDCDCDDCDCDCDWDCDCECGDCDCDDCDCEPTLCLFEIAKDKDGKEILKSISDKKLLSELEAKVDEILSC